MTEQEIMMSPTLAKLCNLAVSMPIDVNVQDELKPAITTCVLSLIDAIDNGRIQFATIEDAAMLHGLLVIGLELAMGGRFRLGLKSVVRN
jgi:hypothetical protein